MKVAHYLFVGINRKVELFPSPPSVAHYPFGGFNRKVDKTYKAFALVSKWLRSVAVMPFSRGTADSAQYIGGRCMKKKMEPGQKSDILAHCYNEDRWTIIDLNDHEAVYKRIREYFEKCIEDDKFATVAGMANALNVSRQAVDQWISGKINKDPLVVQAVEWGKRVINAQNEESLMESRGNPVGTIFLTKNNFDNYTDTREIITRKETTNLTAEELLKLASKLPGFEDRLLT